MILTIKLTGTVIFNTFFFQRIVTVVIYFLFYKVDYCKLSVLLVVLQFGFYLVETCWPSYISLCVIQKEMTIFRETAWNSHRVRHQRDAQMPKGIPSNLYSFPEQWYII